MASICCPELSKRWEIILLLMIGITICYTLRVNMSVAVIDMEKELDWSEAEKGLALSSFYWGYAFGQVPSSMLAKAYGARTVFGLSVLIPSFLTLLIPVTFRTSFPLGLFLRAILGLFESSGFPALFQFFPKWVPFNEKLTLIPMSFNGIYLGEIIGFGVSGIICEWSIQSGGQQLGEWPLVFYLFGFIGICYYPVWMWLAYESPDVHPTISAEEREYISRSRDAQRAEMEKAAVVAAPLGPNGSGRSMEIPKSSGYEPVPDADKEGCVLRSNNCSVESTEGYVFGDFVTEDKISDIPWDQMFQHRVMLIIFLGAWTHGWIGFMMCSELPNYLTDLGLDLESAGYLSTIPFIGVFCGNIAFGRMFKYLEDEKGWTVTEVRRMSLIIGQGVSSICLTIAGFLSSVPLAFFFTVLCLTFYGASNSCLGCCYLDVAPRFSAQFNAVGNTFSALGGIASPLFVAQILGMFPGNPDDAIHTCDGGDCDDDIAPGKWGWTVVFLFTAAQGWTTIILWSLVYKPDVIPELNTPRAEQKSTAMDDENLKARLI